MTAFETFILSLFDMLMFLILFQAIIQDKTNNIIKIINYLIIGAIPIGLLDYFLTNDVLIHLCSTLVNIIWLKTYSKNVLKKIPSFFTVFLIRSTVIFTIQFLSIIIIIPFFVNFTFSFKYGIIAQITGILFTIIIYKFVPIKYAYIFIEQKNKWFQTIIVNLYLIYYLLSIFWFLDINDILQSILGMFIIILITLVINSFILKNGFINQSNKEKLKIYDTYLPVIDTLIEELKSKQHDYHNQLQAITCTLEEIEDIKDNACKSYINQLIQQDIWSTLIKLNNKIIMAFLYSKYKNAQALNI